MINTVTLQGRLTSDPELRTTANGTELAKFTLAVERRPQKDKDKVTDFIPCTVFGAMANMVGKWFAKGQMMICSGRLTVEQYKGKDGKNKTFTHVVLDEVSFGGDKKAEGKPAQTKTKAKPPVDDYDIIGDEEDLPF